MIECSKSKPKVYKRPIRRNENIFESQYELIMNSTKLPKVRENAGVQIVIDFSFHPVGLESDASFVDQAQREVMQKQSYSGLLSTLT